MSHAPWARIGDRWTGGERSYGPKYFRQGAQHAGASADTASVARAAGPLIHLGTRCGTVDEFVERFAPFATDTSLVMPTASEVEPGTEGRFVIHLKDRTPVMSGRCRVEEVRPVASGGGRMVMRVRLLGMDEPSRNVHRQLLACKRPAPAAVVPKPPPLRIVRAPTLIGAPAPPIGTAPTLIGTLAPPLPAPPPPLPGDELDKTMESIKVPEVQAPSAAFTLPANPLSDLEAGDLSSFIECTLFEADGDLEASPERAASDDAKTPHALVEDVALKPAAPQVSRSDASVADVAHAQLRHRLVQAAPYALCTVIGVLVGAILRSSPQPSPPRVAREPRAVATPAIVAPPVITPIAPAPTTPAPERAPTPIAALPSGACAVSVTTEPPDAVVLWGAQELGHTPLAGGGALRRRDDDAAPRALSRHQTPGDGPTRACARHR